jgi:phosphoglycolate phosphatase-like HAD superfamily hydrolase
LEGGGVDAALIDWLAGFFGVRSPVRSPLTASAREAHPETRLLIIGDTRFDRQAAKAAYIPFLAVCTGKYDRSAFQDSAAATVIDTLTEVYETIRAAMLG